MVVAIKPSQFRGGVPPQVGLPESPLEALTKVLDASIGLATDVIVRKKDRELEEGKRLLANPLITASEIFEIQRDANFPLLKLKAENREGSLIAELSHAAAVDAVSKEDDPIAARKILAELQKEAMEKEDYSDGVLAGIRERWSEFSPQILDDASAIRVQRRDRQEAVNLDAALTESLNTGILSFGTALSGAIIDEKFVVNGDLGAFYDNVVITIENFYLKGDDNTEVNVNASRAMAAIDLVMESDFKLKPVERKKFSKLRQKMEDAEETALTRSVTRGDDAKARNFLSAATKLARHRQEDPFGPANEDILDLAIKNAPTAGALASFKSDFYAAPEDPETTGVANSPIWANARRNLIKQFTKSITGTILELTADQGVALDLFDGIAEQLPSELREDRPKLQGLAASFVREAIQRGDTLAAARTDREKAFNTNAAEFIKNATDEAAAGNFTKAISINLDIAKEREKFLVQKRQQVILLWIAEHGYRGSDFVNTHTEGAPN